MDDDAKAWIEAGFDVEGHEPDPCYCWPENWKAYQYFLSVSDQWSVSPGGTIMGLKGESVWPMLASEGVGKGVYDDLTRIAHGAIRAFNEQRERRK